MYTKVIFATLLVTVLAGQNGQLNDNERGFSTVFRKQDENQYSFGYDINDHFGAFNGRRESGDSEGNKFGSYHIRDIDGRVRTVNYVADKDGFRAKIDTNEPGTITHQAADAFYNGQNVLRVNHGDVGFGQKGDNGHSVHH